MINVEELKNGEICYGILNITKPAEANTGEMTLAEECKELGREIKIIKE
jgi:hypothetical protein